MIDETQTDDPLWRDPRNAAEQMEQGRLEAAWRAVMGSPDGRLVLGDILARCHLYESSLKPGGDALGVVALEGERAVGLFVRNARAMQLEPQAFALILREWQEREDVIAAGAAEAEDED